jgi:hypothetical protein
MLQVISQIGVMYQYEYALHPFISSGTPLNFVLVAENSNIYSNIMVIRHSSRHSVSEEHFIYWSCLSEWFNSNAGKKNQGQLVSWEKMGCISSHFWGNWATMKPQIILEQKWPKSLLEDIVAKHRFRLTLVQEWPKTYQWPQQHSFKNGLRSNNEPK